MNYESMFKQELGCIENDRIRIACLKIVKLLPQYWFEVAAASTGKYQPEYAQGDGGLLRHSKAAMRIGYELLVDPAIGDKYTSVEKDLMLVALIMHDGLKSGLIKEKYTRFDHPLLVAKLIRENQDKINLTTGEINFLTQAIETHMGEWNKDFNDIEVLPLPKNKYQRFVHMCDFLASKKFIEVLFENNEIVG